MQLIEYFLYICLAADFMLSYYNVKKFKDKFPDRNWTLIENNAMIRILWQSQGMFVGTLIAIVMGWVLMYFIIYYFLSERLFWTVFGIYIMIFKFHWITYKAIKNAKLKPEEIKKNNRVIRKPINKLNGRIPKIFS